MALFRLRYFVYDMLGWVVANKLEGSWFESFCNPFYEKELQKTNQEEFRIEKVIKRKGNKLYVKWKGYDNSFNSWIDKNDII